MQENSLKKKMNRTHDVTCYGNLLAYPILEAKSSEDIKRKTGY